jgi:putative membrane protein
MSMKKMALQATALMMSVMIGSHAASAAATASDQDKTFVAKVSQGGMYEVELGKVAETKGSTQDIRDQGNTEAHDHDLVGQALKTAADSAGLTFPTELNADFKARLASISASSGVAFDKAYIADMKKIHAADGAAFLTESKQGTNPALKEFAASTYNIVQRHVGELGAKTTTLK